MAEQEQDRTEPATPSKLREAKRQGQVPKSLEFNSLAIIAAGLGVAYMLGESIFVKLLKFQSVLLSKSDQLAISQDTTHALFATTVGWLLEIIFPFIAILMAVAVLVNLVQTGPVFSLHPLKPDFKKLNPVTGIKRLFSVRLLYETGKNIIKIVIFGSIIYFAISGLLQELVHLTDVNVKALGKIVLELVIGLVFKLLVALAIIAIFDVMFSRWEYAKKLRMSRRELKEEYKRSEGDPHVKSKMRQLQRDKAKRQGSIGNTPNADVLLTNPTHLAVALKYERETMTAPHVIAKGAGEVAQRMRALAQQNNVPIVQNKKLARKLYRTTAINQPIPSDVYPVVAKILVWVYAMRGAEVSA